METSLLDRETEFSDFFKKYMGTPVRLTVKYHLHRCVGEMDDECHSYVDYPPKEFSYPILGIFKRAERYDNHSAFFMLSSDEGKDILVPFEYEIKTNWQPGWCMETLYHSIDSMVLVDNSKIVPDYHMMACFDDGATKVSSYRHFCSDEEALALDKITLDAYGCKYERDKHAITGDISRFMETMTPMWK